MRHLDHGRALLVAATTSERMGSETQRRAADLRRGGLGDHSCAGRVEGWFAVIGLVTDSNAQLPRTLVDRYDIEVVPLGIVIDGKPYREGVDLDVDDFYAQLSAGAQVSTSTPPPAAFIEAYEAVAARGADEILSIHVGSDLSATLSSARIASSLSPVAVELVDSTTASFALGCCVWESAEHLAAGATLEQVASAARGVAARVGNVFIVDGLDPARKGGRLAVDIEAPAGLAVLALEGGVMRSVGSAADVDDAIGVMTDYVQARIGGGGGGVRVGVGDAQVPHLASLLAQRLSSLEGVVEIVRYAVGPSVGCHTGVGSVGAVFYRR